MANPKLQILKNLPSGARAKYALSLDILWFLPEIPFPQAKFPGLPE